MAIRLLGTRITSAQSATNEHIEQGIYFLGSLNVKLLQRCAIIQVGTIVL